MSLFKMGVRQMVMRRFEKWRGNSGSRANDGGKFSRSIDYHNGVKVGDAVFYCPLGGEASYQVKILKIHQYDDGKVTFVVTTPTEITNFRNENGLTPLNSMPAGPNEIKKTPPVVIEKGKPLNKEKTKSKSKKVLSKKRPRR